MTTTYIIGHQKPDTDAVVATLAFKYLFDSINHFNHSNSVPCITHDLNPETSYIFNKFNQAPLQLIKASDIKSDDKIVLVDHNETSQQLEGINSSQITDIFDHHKINLNFDHPIFANFKPWGSTCTIAWYLLDLHQVKIPETLSSLMACAIISDTVGFKSSTTTDVDKTAVTALLKNTNLNLDNLIFEVLKAKSDVSSLSDLEIITKDYKVYDFSNKKVFISQVETVEQAEMIKTKGSSLLSTLIEYKNKQGFDYAFVAISDILRVNTQLLSASDNETKLADAVFGGKSINNLLDIGEKLSRKKDIAPPIERGLHE